MDFNPNIKGCGRVMLKEIGIFPISILRFHHGKYSTKKVCIIILKVEGYNWKWDPKYNSLFQITEQGRMATVNNNGKLSVTFTNARSTGNPIKKRKVTCSIN